MADPPCTHERCPGRFMEMWAVACRMAGAQTTSEITLSTEPPLVDNPYTAAMKCPHGVTFYIEPTSDQIAQWARDGVR